MDSQSESIHSGRDDTMEETLGRLSQVSFIPTSPKDGEKWGTRHFATRLKPCPDTKLKVECPRHTVPAKTGVDAVPP